MNYPNNQFLVDGTGPLVTDSLTKFKLLILVLTGTAGLSDLGGYMTGIFSLPFYLPEIFVLPALIVFRRTIASLLSRGMMGNGPTVLVILLLSWLALSALGSLHSPGLRSIITSSRSYLYILLVAFVTAQSWSFRTPVLAALSAGSVGGTFLTMLLKEPGSYRDELMFQGCIAGLFHLLVLGFLSGRLLLILPINAIGVIRVIFSGYRKLIAVMILATMVGLLALAVRTRRWVDVLRIGSALAGIFIAIIFAGYIIQNTEFSRHIEHRIITRTEAYLTGNWSEGQDYSRLDGFIDLPIYALEHLVPRGIPPKGATSYTMAQQTGFFLDLPIREIFWIFGSIVGTFILLLIAWKALGRLWQFNTSALSLADLSLSYSCVLYGLLVLVSGSFLWHFYEVVFFGFSLGLWFRRRNVVTG